MEKVKRICVVGAPGNGKTTLSLKLEKIFGLPVCHLDSIHQKPDWVLRDTKERDEMMLKESEKDEWIQDGTYINTLYERANRSDLVVYLRYRTRISVKGVIDRIIRNHGKDKPDMPGCKEKFDLKFIWYVATSGKKMRKMIDEIVEKLPQDKILIFKNRKQLKKWLDSLQ